jgi:hypothetical protein
LNYLSETEVLEEAPFSAKKRHYVWGAMVIEPLRNGHRVAFLSVEARDVINAHPFPFGMPFEGVPASLGPGMRTASGARVSNIMAAAGFVGLEGRMTNPRSREKAYDRTCSSSEIYCGVSLVGLTTAKPPVSTQAARRKNRNEASVILG